MKTVTLPSGATVPAFGLGTWCLGDQPAHHQTELQALRLGLDEGATLVDTAEMYGDGRSESLVGEAITGRRDEVFLVTKVLPHNASRAGTIAACEASLRRLGTDRIDLYLLHWRGSHPLAETLEAFERLQRDGKIVHWGVSNFDTDDMAELAALSGGEAVTANQVRYNLSRRGIEWDLLPWQRQRHVPTMAYSPIEQTRLLDEPKLIAMARGLGMTPAQVALAWLMARDDVIVIPRTGHPDRMRENLAARTCTLSPATLAELDQWFPPPDRPTPLEML